MGRFLLHPLTPVLFYSVAFAGLLFTQLVLGLSRSRTFEYVTPYCWAILFTWWIVTDARRRKHVPCFDFDLFCYLFLPLAVPWYCFWSRGWRGVITLFALGALWLGPYIVANVVWVVLYG